MSKVIKITQEHIDQAKVEFEKYLETAKLSDGRITFNKPLGTIDAKAELCFTEIAWLKMQTLIREFSKEIAWHGVAYREEDSETNGYLVTDILVYPQTVTGASVDMDETEYANWLMKNAEDDRFYNIHFQGHSHVNMPVSPSGVDLNHQEDILDMLDAEEGFYIFVIWNKRNERTIKIYDMKKNILFENSDITVTILKDGTGIESFLDEAKSLVKEPKPVVQTSTNGAYKGATGINSYYQQQCSANNTGGTKKGSENKDSDKSPKGKKTDKYRDGGKQAKSAYDYYDESGIHDGYGGYGAYRDY